MSYTQFGEFVRHLRVKNHQVMGDMAKLLGTSTSNLSAVENGKKNVPKNWISTIVKHYNLSEDETSDLMNAISESRTQVKLKLEKADSIKRQTALQFARSFENMDDETASLIKNILERQANGLHDQTD